MHHWTIQECFRTSKLHRLCGGKVLGICCGCLRVHLLGLWCRNIQRSEGDCLRDVSVRLELAAGEHHRDQLYL